MSATIPVTGSLRGSSLTTTKDGTAREYVAYLPAARRRAGRRLEGGASLARRRQLLATDGVCPLQRTHDGGSGGPWTASDGEGVTR